MIRKAMDKKDLEEAGCDIVEVAVYRDKQEEVI